MTPIIVAFFGDFEKDITWIPVIFIFKEEFQAMSTYIPIGINTKALAYALSFGYCSWWMFE
jgi:hypothetical protein